MAVYGGSDGFEVVSSQFHIVHAYESHHVTGEPWNSLMKQK